MNQSDEPELKDERMDWVLRLFSSDDRSLVILGAAAIEDSLEALLTSAIGLTNTKMFDFQSPLGNLSARIDICFALKLIDKDQYDALTALRKIRNDAAHEKNRFFIHDELKHLNRLTPYWNQNEDAQVGRAMMWSHDLADKLDGQEAKLDTVFALLGLRNELEDLAAQWEFSGSIADFVRYRQVPETVVELVSNDGPTVEDDKRNWLARNGL